MKRKRRFHVTWTHAISLGRTLFEKDAAIQIARWQHSASYWLPAENGPATTLPIALSLYKSCGRIDFVILDINLRGTAVFPMARCLSQDGVPFLFCTGYDDQPVRSEFAGVPRFEKPVCQQGFAEMIDLIDQARQEASGLSSPTSSLAPHLPM